MARAHSRKWAHPDSIMWLGYNTNGFACHGLEDTLNILADLGYQSVAITLDHHALNPYADNFDRQLRSIQALLHRLRLRTVIETGARFLLDPWHKHQPTLLSPTPDERDRRLDFLRRAVHIAEALESDAVSLWSGTPVGPEANDVLWQRLTEGCRSLCAYAEEKGVRLAFEPEPGMFIDTMPKFERLHRAVNHSHFGLTIDIGHLHCMGEVPIADHLRHWRDIVWSIHIEDMRRGVHEHLMFGEGEIDFGPVFQALDEIGYGSGVHVELSRHSFDAVETARRAMAFLEGQMQQVH